MRILVALGGNARPAADRRGPAPQCRAHCGCVNCTRWRSPTATGRRPTGEHHVRMAYGVDEDAIERAFDRVAGRFPAWAPASQSAHPGTAIKSIYLF